MSVSYGFFNSVSGDRKYNAEQINEFFGQLISSGVLPNPSTNLQVTAGGGMTVNVAEGKGFVDSHWVKNDSILNLTIDTADSVLNRIDAVIMKLDLNINARSLTIEVKKGTPASYPLAPTMTRTTTVKEYCLATVTVGKSVTSLTQSNIKDTRADNSVCGWVTGLIQQVDTSTLYKQWETAYEEQYNLFREWYESLTGELNVNAYIRKFEQIIEPTEPTNEYPLTMEGYEYEETDIFLININGFQLNPVHDYTINMESFPYIIETKANVQPGSVINITILKSVIGSTGHFVTLVQDTTYTVDTHVKVGQTIYYKNLTDDITISTTPVIGDLMGVEVISNGLGDDGVIYSLTVLDTWEEITFPAGTQVKF